CGHVSDGCAGTIDCGGCGSGEHCSAGTCGPTECIPQAAEVLCAGKCGTLSDGCGGKIECSEANGGTSCSFFDYCGFGESRMSAAARRTAAATSSDMSVVLPRMVAEEASIAGPL